MARSSQAFEFQYDPEIEKTACRLRKEAGLRKRHLKEDLEIDVTICGKSIFEESEVKMADRTLKELAAPYLDQQPLCITYPNIANDFELKSGLIHLLPSFRGCAGEDLHKHLKEFHIVCSGMKPHGVTEEQINFRAFPFSLKDQAKD
jgi:hypothetical protein